MTNSRWKAFTQSMMRPFSAAQLPFAGQYPLHRGEPFQPDRAACMQAVGRNADLGAQAVFETIGKAGGQVDIHGAGVDLALKAGGGSQVFGDDGVRVLRTVVLDLF